MKKQNYGGKRKDNVMFRVNNIVYHIVKTWVFTGESKSDPLDGITCLELKSSCGKHMLISDSETLSSYIM